MERSEIGGFKNAIADAVLSVEQAVYGDFTPGPAHHPTRNAIKKMLTLEEWKNITLSRVEQHAGTNQLVMRGVNLATTDNSINRALPVFSVPLSTGKIQKNIAIYGFRTCSITAQQQAVAIRCQYLCEPETGGDPVI